jgi:hypothetical protein
MKHLKKYNESTEHPTPYTWDELIYIINNNEVSFVNCEKGDIIEWIENYLTRISNPTNSTKPWYNPDINTSPISNPYRRGGNLIDVGNENVLVLGSDGKPSAIIGEYEMSNPFIFDDVVIVPGHDSITCYNMKTGKHITSHIR